MLQESAHQRRDAVAEPGDGGPTRRRQLQYRAERPPAGSALNGGGFAKAESLVDTALGPPGGDAAVSCGPAGADSTGAAIPIDDGWSAAQFVVAVRELA